MSEFIKIPVKTIYMEMRSRPDIIIHEIKNAEIKRADKPDPDYYLEIYKKVGEIWGWAGRLIIDKEQLRDIIQHELVDIYYLYVEKKIAGFFEIEKRKFPDIELIYMGLLPEYIGSGYGKYLLNSFIKNAWDENPIRLWLHTCEFDHKSAIKVYEKAGFKIYDKRIDNEYYHIDFLKKRGIKI